MTDGDGVSRDRRGRDGGGSVGAKGVALLVGDVHLLPVEDEGLERFARFVAQACEVADCLYILGDLFDVWTGPRSRDLAGHRRAGEVLRAAAARGLVMTWLPGNRDFNLDQATGERFGLRLAGDVLTVSLPSGPALLTHGDLFLTGDRAYQRLRVVLRSGPLRWLARHLPVRLAARLAERLRRGSRRAVARKDRSCLAIVPQAVIRLMGPGPTRAVCGHVHRADRLKLEGGRELWTLGAFAEGGYYLWDAGHGLEHRRFEG